MATRKILLKGEKALNSHCRPVTEFNDRLHTLLDDMKETLVQSGGALRYAVPCSSRSITRHPSSLRQTLKTRATNT